jgi:hypothetical protein
MKHGKRPTRKQKILISNLRLNPDNWLVLGEDKEFLIVVHRHTDRVRKLPKI